MRWNKFQKGRVRPRRAVACVCQFGPSAFGPRSFLRQSISDASWGRGSPRLVLEPPGAGRGEVLQKRRVRVAEGRGRVGRAGSRVPDEGGPWPSSSSWRPLFRFWSLARVVWFFCWSEMVWSRAFEDVVEGKKAEGGGWARSRMAGEWPPRRPEPSRGPRALPVRLLKKGSCPHPPYLGPGCP